VRNWSKEDEVKGGGGEGEVKCGSEQMPCGIATGTGTAGRK